MFFMGYKHGFKIIHPQKWTEKTPAQIGSLIEATQSPIGFLGAVMVVVTPVILGYNLI